MPSPTPPSHSKKADTPHPPSPTSNSQRNSDPNDAPLSLDSANKRLRSIGIMTTALIPLAALALRSYLAPTFPLDAAAGGVVAWTGDLAWVDSLPASAQYLDQKSFNVLGSVQPPDVRNGSNVSGFGRSVRCSTPHLATLDRVTLGYIAVPPVQAAGAPRSPTPITTYPNSRGTGDS
jgi:hypothetical protein